MQNNFIEKKRVVVDTLQMLIGYWDLAPELLEFVNSDKITEEILDGFIDIFIKSLDEVKDEDQKKKILGSIEILTKLREKEFLEKQKEAENANNVLTDLF